MSRHGLQVQPEPAHILEVRGHLLADRQRLAAGEQVARMYQEPGLAWLERQAEVAEDLVAERRAATGHRNS